jgi:hypothetical protein
MTGNFVIGASVIVCPFGAMRSIIALHDCLTFPLMIIVHEPHTSSRQTHSQTTGATFLPSLVTGCFWISINAATTFMWGCHAMAKSSQ